MPHGLLLAECHCLLVNALFAFHGLLAQADPTAPKSPFEQLRENFSKRMGQEAPVMSVWQFVFLIVILVVAVFAVRYIVERLDFSGSGGHGVDSAKELFRELAIAHALPWRDRRLLRRIAKEQEMTDPARLFLEPDRLVMAAHTPRFASERKNIIALGVQLFRDIETFGTENGEPTSAPPEIFIGSEAFRVDQGVEVESEVDADAEPTPTA